MMRPRRRPGFGPSWTAVASVALLVALGTVPTAHGAAIPDGGDGCAACAATGPALPKSGPAPSSLDAYEIASNRSITFDPAEAYSPAALEPIVNIYQSLITYDGNNTTTFLPELATCVPGSAACVSLYGSSLVANGPAGVPEFFTFPIDPTARFYDPATHVGWPVYPSDVLFSYAREESFAEADGVGVTSGWMPSQALLPLGNSSWDGGLHAPYNNTPQNVLSSILVNDSTYCPTIALQANGCVTFDADGSDTVWPFLLSILAGPAGAAIEPCGWFTFVGAGVPGFNGTTAPYGDGPCLLPGGANSSFSAVFQTFLADTPATYWDGFQSLALNAPDAQPSVRLSAVGSGPYYLVSVDPNTGYVLRASPVYQAPSGCVGTPGCEPLPGTYAPSVDVFWEANDSLGVAQYATGRAALAAIGPADVSAVESLESAGKIGSVSIPTLVTGFQTFNLDFNATNESDIDPTHQLNVPGDFFSYTGIREFLALAYPYSTIAQTALASGLLPGAPGTQGFAYGGAIPQYLGNDYPTNISWPSTDPVSNASVVGSAGWYWAELHQPTSLLFDPELTACQPADPCRFPFISGYDGSPLTSNMTALWIYSVINLSAGALEPYSISLTFPDADYLNPPTNYATSLGAYWATDYPDPTDPIGAMYAPNSTYAAEDSVAKELTLPAFNSPTCGAANATWSDLLYWGHAEYIPTECQGVAYAAMSSWIDTAARLAPGAYRTLVYNEIESVANALALYVYDYQLALSQTYASWIAPNSLNANPMIGGAGIETWYTVREVAPPPATTYPVTFIELGLPQNTSWSVSVNDSTETAHAATIEFDLANGSYSFTIEQIGGYSLTPSTGTVIVNGTSQNVWASYQLAPAAFSVQFMESGLPVGTPWSVTLDGSQVVAVNSSAITFSLENGTYAYTIGPIPGYSVASPSGTFWVNGTDQNISVRYNRVVATYTLEFVEIGLPAGTTWSIVVGSVTENSSTTSDAWSMPNGTYAFSAGATGFRANPANGTAIVHGASRSVYINFTSDRAGASAGGPSWLGLPAWAWAALGAVAIVVGVGLLLLRPKRRDPG